jgi:hypothetical protein
METLLLDVGFATGLGQPVGQPVGRLLLTRRAGAPLDRGECLDD